MVKLNLLLVLVLVACALSVVSARHQARKLFVALQSEQARGRDLDVEWGQLQLEIPTLALFPTGWRFVLFGHSLFLRCYINQLSCIRRCHFA